MSQNENRCPSEPDEVAENFVLALLPEAEERVYREHLKVCLRCKGAVLRAEEFVRAVRDAAKDFSPDKE